MDDVTLPVEICENIIDHCDPPKRHCFWLSNFQESHGALRACSLVCSAWFPRSRRNLLREVRLDSFDHADLLLRLKEKPHLTELVTAIYISGAKFVPFARFALPRLLPNCRFLIAADVLPSKWKWSQAYPPGYPRFMSDFRELTELVLRADGGLSAPKLFHIIWSLPPLNSLKLSYFKDCPRIERFGGKFRQGSNSNRRAAVS